MPLLQDLPARLTKALRKRIRIPREIEAMMADDFAHALSYLEQAKPWLTEADNLRDRALFLDISHEMARDLEETVSSLERSADARPPNWLGQLVRYWHAHRSTVITLNYDTLIESAAATVEVDGERIVAQQIYPLVLMDAGIRAGGAGVERGARSFRLLKLHGSTNWYYSGRAASHGEPIYFIPPLRPGDVSAEEQQGFAVRRRAVADKYPFLVPPIYDKSPLLTHETIRALWFQAGEAVRHASRVVSMGYSLPESDLTMRHFLRATCGGKTKLVVVNESGAATRNFRRIFQTSGIAVEDRATGRSSIADFVASLDHA